MNLKFLNTNSKDSNAKLALQSPWMRYVNRITALFGADPEIRIEYDNDVPEVKFYVDNGDKAEAIGKLLPTKKTFGNVSLAISIVPANHFDSNNEIVKHAFKGNPTVSFIKETDGSAMQGDVYVVFKNEVVQFFEDDMSDIYGMHSTIYQDIAKELFEDLDASVRWCTDAPGNPGMNE